jgi:hypothetical protein
MALEFPDDTATFANSTGTSQQFMAGPWFLVAPVYRPLAETPVRDGIYLPAGDWVDYWNWDTIITGPNTINGYNAPLDTLPLFVRAGAIVPMWPEMLYPGQVPADPLTLELFPAGSTSFELYEDDGMTRQALEGSAFAKTNISCVASASALTSGGEVKLSVGPSVGSFKGQMTTRSYDVRVHAPNAPFQVLLTDATGTITILEEMRSLAELDYAASGWFFVKGFTGNHRGGLVVVKTPSIATKESFSVTLTTGTHVPHIALRDCGSSSEAVDPQVFDFDNNTGLVTLRGNSSACLSVGEDRDPDSGTAAVEILPCAPGNAKQSWDFTSEGYLRLRSDAAHCVDLDRTDRMAEMYTCYGPPANPNQKWTHDGTSGRITSGVDGSCMTAASPDGIKQQRVTFV